jgi:hypothetical protein
MTQNVLQYIWHIGTSTVSVLRDKPITFRSAVFLVWICLVFENIRERNVLCHSQKLTVNLAIKIAAVDITSHHGNVLTKELVDSKGFRRWCITRGITGFLDFVHRPVF